MIEGQSHINGKRAAWFTIVAWILIIASIVILWNFGPKEIGAIAAVLAVPFLIAAMYYDGIFGNDNKEVKPRL